MLAVAILLLVNCGSHRDNRRVDVEFSRIPQADPGGRDKNDIIEGQVRGSLPGEQIVLYARSGDWWVQPLSIRPFTKIQPDSKWTNATHLGTEYAALLVQPGFQPPATFAELPERGGLITAVAAVKGASSPPSASIQFSGYEWRVRDAPSTRGGKSFRYDPRNVWTDADGALHLRINKFDNQWTCAEVSLTRSLGYGTYSFIVRDTSQLEPAATFSMFTWDYARPDQNFSEVDIEIGRWGDAEAKNGQYTIQPYYVPPNGARFSAPAGILRHSFRWEPGRMSFRTSRVSAHGEVVPPVAEHVFTSGIPAPGIESMRLNLYIYGYSRVPLKNASEVVVEKFEYLP
jgi:hypothetical protein